jgi:rubrerythrin
MNNEKANPLLVALKAEKESYALYTKMIHQSCNPTGKKMFEMLAKQEKDHIEKILKQLKKAKINPNTKEIKEKATLLSENDFDDCSLSDFEVIEKAIEDERHAFAFYKRLMEASHESAEIKFFAELMADEEKHMETLEDEAHRIKKGGK